jgi:hypothetical protein
MNGQKLRVYCCCPDCGNKFCGIIAIDNIGRLNIDTNMHYALLRCNKCKIKPAPSHICLVCHKPTNGQGMDYCNC